MLISLRIANLGIIKEAALEFGPSLNIVTGETGSGKSMFVKALMLLFGLSKNNELAGIHDGDLSVEACFEMSDHHLEKLREAGYDFEDNELFIQRTASGKSNKLRSLVNGRAVPASELQKLAELFIEKHGQNSTQKFLAVDNHLGILDSYIGERITMLLEEYGQAYKRNLTLKAEVSSLNDKAGSAETELDFMKYQLAEIEQAQLQEGEDIKLSQEKNTLQNLEKIDQLYSAIDMALGNSGDRGATDLISSAVQDLEKLSSIDASFDNATELARQSLIFMEEAGNELKAMRPDSENAGERLENIEQRLHLISRLKKKYGEDIQAILGHMEKLKAEVNVLENMDFELEIKEKELNESNAELFDKARELHRQREVASKAFEEAVTMELRELNMPDAEFIVSLKELVNLRPCGVSAVEFLIRTNKGAKPMSLEKIISGGEMSRIALTIKTMLSGNSSKCLIFDEIDAGIGGKTANYVGRKLQSIAKSQQTLCITHSPQIAAYAGKHFGIEKVSSGESTETHIRELSGEERLNELARMLSGKSTDISMRHASELLDDIGVLN